MSNAEADAPLAAAADAAGAAGIMATRGAQSGMLTTISLQGPEFTVRTGRTPAVRSR
jgi:hypothetical protein